MKLSHFKFEVEKTVMRYSIFLFVLLSTFALSAQILDPVKWSFELEQVNENEWSLVFTANIDEGWSVYSQYLERDDGPIATSIQYDDTSHFELVGKSIEDDTHRKEGYDPFFDMNLTKYFTSMRITQQILVNKPAGAIKGYLTYMTCDDSKCLPPQDVEFTFNLVENDSQTETSEVSIDEDELIRNEQYLFGLSEVTSLDSPCDETQPVIASGSYWSIFVLGLLGGLIALLTPCVFPLIPLTVSFFTKKSDEKSGYGRAILYGFFIFLIYVLLSLPFHLLDSINSEILNEISTNQWLNLLFFFVFLVFALSFFGMFEINLPSSLTNKISAAEGVGGVIGIFFMAFTLCLVSFSCTGPILGSLLAGALSSDGGAWQLTAGMAGFGVALALPFAVFAMFPNWMSKLPKSGSWLNTVKISLGFIEIALALKFLSNVDLVLHWGILKYELFIFLWIIIDLLLSLYLFGILRFSSDEKKQSIGKGRLAFGIVFGLSAIYLSTGFSVNKETHTFKSLHLLSGLAPPSGYSWVLPSACPNGFECYKDLKSGISAAKMESKPILLDFTGYACVNCRKMEEQIWSQPEVYNLINENYILVSLYVDDKQLLPENEQINVRNIDGSVRKLKTIGNKWAYFQAKYFNNNSQPNYVILSSDARQMLVSPIGYTPDKDKYVGFLNCGLASFIQ